MKRGTVPALVLFLISPLIAEYLLGSVSFDQINALPVLCLMYGSGVVIIRETARASNRGWPTIALLGAAYAIAEEAFATQALFNPHFHGFSLLEYGYIPTLGIGAWFTVYVIGLHVIWSVCVPIAIVEALFPNAATTPWLGSVGRTVFGLFLILGMAAVALGTYQTEQFVASKPQFLLAGIAIAVLIVGALWLRPKVQRSRTAKWAAPSPWTVGAFCFVAGSGFELSQTLKQMGIAWFAPVAVMAALAVAAVVMLLRWSRGSGWTTTHVFAAGTGALLVHCWFGYGVEINLHGRGGLVAHSVLVVLTILLVALIAFRLNRRTAPSRVEPEA